MTRRSVRRNARGASESISRSVALSRLLPFSWFEADTYSVDGGTGKVASFAEKVSAGTGIKASVPSHVIAQSNTTYQVAVPVAQSALNNALCATFSSHVYQSSATAAAWKFLSDGTGFELFHVFSVDSIAAGYRTTLATRAYLSNATGFAYLYNTTVGEYDIFSANSVVVSNQVVPPLAVGVGACANMYYLEGRASNEWSHQIKPLATVSTGNSSIAPDSGNPNCSLLLGAYSVTAQLPSQQKWGSTIIFNRVLTAAERATAFSYIAAKFGVT